MSDHPANHPDFTERAADTLNRGNAASPDAGLLAAARAFVPEGGDPEPVAGRDHLLRVRTADGAWLVRRLPADAPPERVAAAHALLGWIAAAGAVAAPVPRALPDGATVLALEGARYEARSWLLGQAPARAAVAYPEADRWLNLPGTLSEGAYSEVVAALARLHAASAAASPRDLPRLPAAPLAGMPAAVRGAWQDALRRLRPIAPRTPPAQRWIAAAERIVPAAEAAVAASPPPAESPSLVAHLDLWPGHVLLGDDDALTGLLGWDRAAFGSPLLDLAQAAVRLRGWSAATAEETIAAQGTVRALAAEERRVLPALAALDAVAVAGRLLVAAYAPPPDAPAAPSSLRQAAGRAVESIENAALAMATMDAKARGGASRSGSARRRKVASGPRSRRR